MTITTYNRFGKYYRLDPPQEGPDGTLYGAVLEFTNGPSNRDGSQVLVSGRCIEVRDGNVIVCARGMQTFSITILPGGSPPPIELVYRGAMGGNIVKTHEAARGISWNNAMAVSGDIRGRLYPGCVMWVQQTVNGQAIERGYLIEEAEPYAIAPSVVNFNDEDPEEYESYHFNDCYELRIWPENGGTVQFGDSLAEPYEDAQLYWTKLGGSGACVGYLFDEDVPEYYPSDATFPSDGTSYYHYDPGTGIVHVGPTNQYVTNAATDLLAIYYETGVFPLEVESDDQVTVLAEDGSGYSGAADQVASVVMNKESEYNGSTDAWQITLTVEAVAGTAAIEVRFGQNAGSSSLCAVELTSSGTGSTAWRREPGGSVATSSITPRSYTMPFEVLVDRSTTALNIWARQSDAVSWTLLKSFTVTMATEADCSVGAAAWGEDSAVRLSGLTGTVREARFNGAGGETGIRRSQSVEFEAFKTVGLPTSNGIVRVENLATDDDMSYVGAVIRRDTYGRNLATDPPTLTFYAESAGDSMRVIQEADAEVPDPPGRVPRVTANQEGFAEEDEENPGYATTSVANNRANWHDKLTVNIDADALPTAPFDFVGRLDAGLPPSGWKLQYDERNNAGTDWADVTSSNYHAFPVEGLIYLKQSFVNTLQSAGEFFCWQIVESA